MVRHPIPFFLVIVLASSIVTGSSIVVDTTPKTGTTVTYVPDPLGFTDTFIVTKDGKSVTVTSSGLTREAIAQLVNNEGGLISLPSGSVTSGHASLTVGGGGIAGQAIQTVFITSGGVGHAAANVLQAYDAQGNLVPANSVQDRIATSVQSSNPTVSREEAISIAARLATSNNNLASAAEAAGLSQEQVQNFNQLESSGVTGVGIAGNAINCGGSCANEMQQNAQMYNGNIIGSEQEAHPSVSTPLPPSSDFGSGSFYDDFPSYYSSGPASSGGNGYCGDGALSLSEQCEPPRTSESTYCRQLDQKCDGAKTLTRSRYGNCRNDCLCVYTEYEAQCVAGSCGAGCGTDADCGQFGVCDQSSCQCVSQGEYCGDGIKQAWEECDFEGEQILQETDFCTIKQTCVACELQTSTDAIDSSYEVCDGRDNDCNGVVDDYRVMTCQNEEAYCPNQLGVCAGAERTCQGIQGFSSCSTAEYNHTGLYETSESSCDGFDNDCDGSIDEGCDCVPGSTRDCGKTDTGVCSQGKQTCSPDGSWGSCYGAVNPSVNSELTCDGVDNDCDGGVDECVVNRCGECGQLPEEICNYRDDDCDAEPGSPLNASWDSETRTFTNFSDYCPQGEVCKGVYADGVDNNNDGIIDEGIDRHVRENPAGNATNWCEGCFVQHRRCYPVTEQVFKRLRGNEFERYQDTSLRFEAEQLFSSEQNGSLRYAAFLEQLSIQPDTQDQIIVNESGIFFFSCQENLLDTACCFDNQCVANGQCYDRGERLDMDGDGVEELCITHSPGSWIEDPVSDCEYDCTTDGSNQCNQDCDGVNGCGFFDSQAASVCDGAQSGWLRDYNATHQIACCAAPPQEKEVVLSDVACEDDNIYNLVRLVQYNGELVRMIITVCG